MIDQLKAEYPVAQLCRVLDWVKSHFFCKNRMA